jgi:DnaJ-class molecular chaperone
MEHEVQEIDCSTCMGSGHCYPCEGTGEGARHYSGAEYIYSDECEACNGSGECQNCRGKGRVFSKRLVIRARPI